MQTWAWLLCHIVIQLVVYRPASARLDFTFHDYDQLENYLFEVSANYSNIAHVYSIGQSVEGTLAMLIFSLFTCYVNLQSVYVNY